MESETFGVKNVKRDQARTARRLDKEDGHVLKNATCRMYRVSKAKEPLVWIKIANNRAFVQSFVTYHSEVHCIKAHEL